MKAKTMKEKYEKIMEKKISSSIENLCKGFPGTSYNIIK
jgi:casein kinase 1